jgi:hypothetical protein
MRLNGEIIAPTDRSRSLSEPPLLLTESADDYEILLADLQKEIKPNGVIEQIYLEDLAAIVREMQRLRRSKTAIINNAYRAALQSLLERLLLSPHIPGSRWKRGPPNLPRVGLRASEAKAYDLKLYCGVAKL